MNVTRPISSQPPFAVALAVKRKMEAEKADLKRESGALAGQARANGRFKASDAVKEQARAKVQEIVERLRILKKVFGDNPREMARALGHMFKELKAALKAYKQATGQELGISGDVTAQTMSSAKAGEADKAEATPPAEEAETSPGSEPEVTAGAEDEAQAQQTSAAGETSGAEDARAAADAASQAHATAVYGAANTELREGIARDALEFAKLVRGLANALKDELEGARIKALGKPRDKDTDKVFEETDKSLGDLRDDIKDMEQGVNNAVPTAGIQLSAAA